MTYFVSEIESETIWSDQRAALVSVNTNDLAKCKVENVSTGMICHHQSSPWLIDIELYFITNTKTSFYISDVNNIAPTNLHVFHPKFCFLLKNKPIQ